MLFNLRRGASALGLAAALAVTGCMTATPGGTQAPGTAADTPGSPAPTGTTANTPCKNGQPAPTIAYIAPNNDTPRYEEQDRPAFESAVKELSPNSKFIYFNSEGSVEKQQQQAEAAMVQGASVISFVPNDVKAAATIVREAQQQGVKTISLGRLVQGADVDFLLSYDPLDFGRIQAEALVEAMKTRGLDEKQVVQINGAPTDDLAVGFKQGAHDAFEAAGITVGFDQDDTDWTPATAERLMDQAITALGKDEIGGVYATIDSLAGAAISSMKRAGMDPEEIPVIGGSADLAGVQRVLIGEQIATLYSSIKQDHIANAQASVALGCGEPVPTDIINGSKNNGTTDIPAYLSEWHLVTKDDIKSVILEDNPDYIDVEKLCAAPYDVPCQEAGITP